MWGSYPRVLPRVCPYGIISIGSRVTSFITAQTTFKVSEDILSRSFAPLRGPHPLITSNPLWYVKLWLTDTKLIDVILPILTSTSVRQTRPISGHQQDWKDDKLCHDAPSDTAPNSLAVVMIGLSLLRNHHYKGQLGTTMPSSLWAL